MKTTDRRWGASWTAEDPKPSKFRRPCLVVIQPLQCPLEKGWHIGGGIAGCQGMVVELIDLSKGCAVEPALSINTKLEWP